MRYLIILLLLFACDNEKVKLLKSLENCTDKAYIYKHSNNLLNVWGDIYLADDEEKAIQQLKKNGFKGSLKDARKKIKYERLKVALPRFEKATINEKVQLGLYIDEIANCEKQRKQSPKSFDLRYRK